jgi:hypothetical protein
LYESPDELASQAWFDGEVVEVPAGMATRRFNFDGSIAAPAVATSRCSAPGGVVTIAGRAYPGVDACGVFSPDGQWMLFEKDAGEVQTPTGFSVPSWDQWVLGVATGKTTELQKGLVHCGGCDARYGPRWSPSGRYVAYAELGGSARRFLSEVATGSTRQIGAGNEVTLAPAWHPTEDRIIYSQSAELSGPAVYEDLSAGSTQPSPLPWPVAFDASGRYVYSPAWGPSAKADAGTTTIIDADSFGAIAVLPGAAPDWLMWRTDGGAVVASAGGPVAALQGAPGCEGTAVYVDDSTARCVVYGRFGAHQAPIVRWNDEGTHFVVVAPAATGL